MNQVGRETAQELQSAFLQFKRLHWKNRTVAKLKPSEAMVLFCIMENADPGTCGIKVSEIGKELKVASPTVTQLVNGLEKNGYVERTIDADDRRVVRVSLTDKGEAVLKEVAAVFFSLFQELANHLGEEKSRELAALLSEVFAFFNEVHNKM
ncbi:MAG: MarR family transcriptional regulator [Bacillota bacterium]